MSKVLLLSVLVSTFALAAPEKYSLQCRYNPSKFHPLMFRLNAEYTVTGEKEAKLDQVQGLLFDEPGLRFLATFDGDEDGSIANDPKYKATSDRYKNHLRFYLKNSRKDYSSAPDQQFIIAPEGTDCVTKPWDNKVNTGTDKTCNFHAGLNYHFSDQDGNRTQIECIGVHTVIDRK